MHTGERLRGQLLRLPERRGVRRGEWEDVLGGAQHSSGERPRWAALASPTDRHRPHPGVLEEGEMRQELCCQEGSGM